MIENILHRAGMPSSTPMSYTGNGAIISDLNQTILNKVADLIKQEYGDYAHSNFVEMVWKIEVLSAYAFQNNLYALYQADWNLSKVSLNNKDYLGGAIGDYYMGYDEETIHKIENQNKEDQTEQIRLGFRKN